MCKQILKRVLFFSFIITVFVSCGEMNTLFPSGTSNYRVSAYVNNKMIKDYSIIKNGDTIRPAFLNHISDDPDLTGLQVYIEDSSGNMVSEAINYSLPGRDSSENKGVLVTVNDLNKAFPVFSFPKDLKVGQYTLFFNVLGGKDVLHRSSQIVYYVSDLNFSIDDIRCYLPGVSEGPQLIPPGITILLEVAITSDEGLDPYIVWYNGEKQIGAGKLSEYYHHLLWTVPETTGFQAIKVEIFPFLADNKPAKDTKGIVKELSLPVSSKAVNPHSFGAEAGDAVYWYEFKGNLEPSKESRWNGAILVKTQENPPRWEPLSDVYGLVVGPDDAYDIPDFSVSLNNESDTEYDLHTLKIRFAPKNEGTLFQGSFKTAGSDVPSLNMEVLIEKEGLLLFIQNGSEVYQELISSDLLANKEFIITTLNFYSYKNEFSAYLELQKPLLSTKKIAIPYKGTLSGDGIFRFGAKHNKPKQEIVDENAQDLTSKDVAIIDEFFLELNRKNL